MRIVPININQWEATKVLLSQTVRDLKTDMAIIDEPVMFKYASICTYDSKKSRAIWICGALAFHRAHSAGEGFVRLTIKSGGMLLEFFAQLDVVILNTGSVLTYRKMGAGPIIDIILASDSLAKEIKWRVSEHYTYTDQQAVVIDTVDKRPKKMQKHTGPKWKENMLDNDVLDYMIEKFQTTSGPAEKPSRSM